MAFHSQEERTGLGGRFEGGSGEEDAGEEDQLMAVSEAV